jgi:tetratricopeptide (TPR) repeat protein
VGAIKREPAPQGPIADLFVRLDDLHSKAGRPSMREIAIRAGHNISSSSVHNIFRRSRVPRREFLEHVVNALGGAGEWEEFKVLWDAAWRAANISSEPVSPQNHAGNQSSESWPQPIGAVPQGRGRVWTAATRQPTERIWSSEIPPRNPNFTGRVAELDRISDNLCNQLPPHVQVISGAGGIGKTEIAAEYIHRNIDRYQIIWWIRAEHHDRVRDALVELGQRLNPQQATTDSGRDRAITVVLETLQSDDRPSWLLVYDNVVKPLDLQEYLPAARPEGHIIVTSRQPDWPSYIAADSTAVSPFTVEEAVSFVRRRVPGLAIEQRLTGEEDARRDNEARRLAAELGYLPIAIEHAAAYLVATGQGVDEYLARFAENAHQLPIDQPADSDLPALVSGTWAMSTTLLTSDAVHLSNLCSFFSPEPIAAELFLQSIEGIDEPTGLGEFLASSHRFRMAASQLHRLSLAKVDGARDLIQMHREVRAVTQSRLRMTHGDMFHAYRAAVDSLLARSNPGNPDHSSSDKAYNLSLQHLESDKRFLHTRNSALRDLIIDQVRRLHLRGGHVEAMQFGQETMRIWRKNLGHDDLQVLTLSVEVAIAMYTGGRAADAHELILRIRPLLQRYTNGDGFKVFLLCENIYGADLRAHSQFQEALELDKEILEKFESAFGADHERTLNVRNNIAVDHRQLGDFKKALDEDQRTFDDRYRKLGDKDLFTLKSQNAVARDLRGLGLYQESLDMARKVVDAFEEVGGRENPHWLSAREGFATALRKAGHHWPARNVSEDVVQRCRAYLGADHMYTLRAATNLVNDRRAVDDLVGAEELARETRDLCLASSAPDDLLYAALVNLASVLRVAGRPDEARSCDEQALRGLIRIHGGEHPFTLAASINFASDLAAGRRLGDAIRVGHETLEKCSRTLGDLHPDTLMAGANLAIDEAAARDRAAAELRLAEVLRGYEQTLGMEHPEARAAASGTRLTAEIEPYDG